MISRATTAAVLILALLPGSALPAAAQEVGDPDLRPRSGDACPGGVAPGQRALRGVVRDAGSGIPLPRAVVGLDVGGVSAGLTGRDTVLSLSTRADEEGRYHFCGLPAGAAFRLQARFGSAAGVPVRFPAPAAPVEWTDLHVVTSDQAMLSGVVRDFSTGRPVQGALVRADGAPTGRKTDARGRFLLPAVRAGTHRLMVDHPRYEARADSISVFGDELVDVEVFLAERGVPRKPLQVTGRVRGAEMGPDAVTTTDRLTRRQIDAAPRGGQTLADLLRSAPLDGVSLRDAPAAPVGGTSGLCLEVDAREPEGTCDMAAVYVDGVRLPGDAEALPSVDLRDVESLQVLRPPRAERRLGSDGRNGALLVRLRHRRR